MHLMIYQITQAFQLAYYMYMVLYEYLDPVATWLLCVLYTITTVQYRLPEARHSSSVLPVVLLVMRMCRS